METILNNTIYVFWLCFLCHLIADYNLQGILAQMKQKSWWRKEVKKHFGKRPKGTKGGYVALPSWYDHDWIAGLLCHAIMWSIITYLPMMYTTKAWIWSAIVSVNVCLHSLIDYLKCNRLGTLNLNQDQFLHLVQILCSVAAWHFVH